MYIHINTRTYIHTYVALYVYSSGVVDRPVPDITMPKCIFLMHRKLTPCRHEIQSCAN